MIVKSVVWLLVMLAAYPVHALAAITAIVLILTGKASLIAGAVICGGILYFLARRFVPGFVRGASSLSGYRRQWSSLCWTAFKRWETARATRADENCAVVDFESNKRVDDA